VEFSPPNIDQPRTHTDCGQDRNTAVAKLLLLLLLLHVAYRYATAQRRSKSINLKESVSE